MDIVHLLGFFLRHVVLIVGSVTSLGGNEREGFRSVGPVLRAVCLSVCHWARDLVLETRFNKNARQLILYKTLGAA